MPTARIAYLGSLLTEATHLQSGTTIRTDAPTDNMGQGSAFSPTDLLAVSLATCAITTMGIVAQRDGLALQESAIEVTKVMTTEGPRKVARIEIAMRIPKGTLTDEQIRKLNHAAHACPVSKSLHPDLIQDFQIDWV